MILSVSKQLRHLNLTQYSLNTMSNSNLPHRSCTSSTLTKLNVFVQSFDYCLYLLDGRFEFLSTLIIEITGGIDSMSNRENKVSRNPMSSFEEICLKNHLMTFFCLDKTSSIKMFFILDKVLRIILRRTNCSTSSSNVKSRGTDIISFDY